MTIHKVLCDDDVDFKLCGNRSEHAERLPECSESSVNGYFKCWKLKVEQLVNYDNMLSEVCERVGAIITPLVNTTPVKAQVTVQVYINSLLHVTDDLYIVTIRVPYTSH